jgi:transmembrane sensor
MYWARGGMGQDARDPKEGEKAIEAEAAAWVVRLEAGPLDEAERQAFEAWLVQSETHAVAFAFARETWADLGRLRRAAWRQPNPYQAAQSHLPDNRPVSRRWMWQSLAASLVLAAGLGAFYAGDMRADHRTAPGETRVVALPDGSTAQLNTDTAIALRFDQERREVELLAGEAAFTVARVADAEQRPFVVRAADGRVRALGTRFVVYRRDAVVDVTVLEHRVEIALDGASTAKSNIVVLEAAQAVRYDGASGLGQVRQVDPESAAAWLRGRLVFNQVPLTYAVAELSRYRHGEIIIMNSDLAQRRVSGVFRLDDLDRALGLIAAELDARAVTVPPFITALY